MFFSRISVRESAAASSLFWSTFRNEYSLHQAVWDLFGDHPDRERDFLYHVKEAAGQPVVYTLSARRPNGSNEVWQVDSKEFAPKLRSGMRLAFLLRANPVRTRDGKRHDVVMEEKQRLKAQGVRRVDCPLEAEIVQDACGRWLGARAEKASFRPIAVRVDCYRQHEFYKAEGRRPVRFSTVDFTGLIEVIDTERFFTTLSGGIGPAKGFGCGLMLIRRV
jgi:CRISPR system Cascade subunit CasE